MKNRKFILQKLLLPILLLMLGTLQSFAQPSAAQIKKQLTSAKTVSITLGNPGKIEWSSAYKKYIWTRYFTVRLKTDTPGEILVVKGYAAYDVMGGRYVFWRTFTSDNSYEGKKNPTVEEINRAFENGDFREFISGREIIGEFESMKFAANPDWEWHTPDSVSFTVVAVYNVINRGGSYGDEPQYQSRQGFKAIDKIEAYRRIRLYRKGGNQAWTDFGVSLNIPTPESKYRTRRVEKLLDRQVLPESQVGQMPRISKMPFLTK